MTWGELASPVPQPLAGNPYGINFRQGNITPADFAGKEVACYENAATVDGCYSEVELEVPSPSDLEVLVNEAG